jgi:hypothetical protein
MSTESQIQANRRNSQKSTGPRSAEGKAVVAKNAVKHGLFALETLIKGENREDFDLFHDQFLEELNPAGAVETMLAERIVSLGWRLMRVVRIQDQVFDVMIEKDEPSPMQKKINLMKPKEMRDDRRGAGPELVLGRAVISDMSNSRVLERLLMYERRIENSLHKTLDELHKRKLVREFENANKAIESDDFEMDEAATQRLAPKPALGVKKNAKQSQFQNEQFNVTSIMTKGCDKSLSVCDYAGTRKQSQSFDSAQDKPKPICTPR